MLLWSIMFFYYMSRNMESYFFAKRHQLNSTQRNRETVSTSGFWKIVWLGGVCLQKLGEISFNISIIKCAIVAAFFKFSTHFLWNCGQKFLPKSAYVTNVPEIIQHNRERCDLKALVSKLYFIYVKIALFLIPFIWPAMFLRRAHTITDTILTALTDAPMMMKMWTSDWWNSSSSCSSFLSSPNTSERERGMLLIFSEMQTKNPVKTKKKKKTMSLMFFYMLNQTLRNQTQIITLPNLNL